LAEALPAQLGRARTIAQRNRFYDTADRRLRQQAMNLRLRDEGHRVLLTVKRRLPGDGPGLGRHEEWEEDLPPGTLEAIAAHGPVDLSRLPLPEVVRQALNAAPLLALGGFDNQRLEFDRGAELACLDATRFTARTDHELEIETPDVAASTAWWSALLAELAVPWQAQPASKFARYLAQA
jgi:uncharacterized protein YjbK